MALQSCLTKMSQAEDEEIPLGRPASGTGEAPAAGDDAPGQSKDSQATPAPSQRQLRQTRSQTRHSDVASVDQPHAKANQAVEVSHDYGDEDVDILALSSPSSAEEVDITGSPAVAITAALHAALHADELLQEEQLQVPSEPSLGVGVEVGVPPEPSLPEQPAAMGTEAAGAADDEDVDIEGEPTTAAEDHPEQPSSPATAAEASEAATPAAAKAVEAAEAVTPAPAKAAASAAEHEQPPSRGRGSRGKRGVRGGRGRGRTKPKGKTRATGNSSPCAPSEQDQAEFADQLDQSPSRADAESGDAQAEQSDDKDVSISDTTDRPEQPQKRSSLRRGRSDSQASEQLISAKSQASGEAIEVGAAAPADTKAPVTQNFAAAEADKAKEPKSAASASAKLQKTKEARTGSQPEKEEAAADEPPTKRPRRTASGGKQKPAENSKAKGRRPQARRGVVESESDNSDSNVDIEDVEGGQSAPVSESGEDAAGRGNDDRPQAQAGKKRGRGNEEAPARKGRPKPAPGPASTKGPGPAVTKASKAAWEGAGLSGAAAKTGKGSMSAPPAAKEKRPGSGKQDFFQPPAKSAPGDPKQAADFHKGLLDDAMKRFEEARIVYEEAQTALNQAAGQVESILGNIGQLSGMTFEILKDTNVGKAVGKLSKLGKLHPSITACDQIASKASEVTQLLKKKIGYATTASGHQPQGLPQQPKKAALKPDPKPIPPQSPATAAASEATAPTPAAAPTSAPAVPALEPAQGVSHEAGKPEAAASRQHAVAAPSSAVQPDPAASASHEASHVKVEAASRSTSPAQGRDRRKVLAAAGGAPSTVPQAATMQGMRSTPKLSDTGPSAQSQEPQAASKGLVAESLGDAVRDKAVAILALALTSPSELTPQEAAVAVEAAVFAHFAEQGKPASRYKRRLHALWSYLRGTDHGEVVPNLRQKVLQGEIMSKTLAKITRAQAQHLCQLKSIPGSQPKQQTQPPVRQTQPLSHPLQQPQSQQLQSNAQQQQQLPQQLPQQQQQLPQQQQQQQQVHHEQPSTAVQQQQSQLHHHAQYYQAAAAPYSAPSYGYDPARFQQPWHNALPHPHHHQQLSGVQVAPPGATLPPFDVHTAIPAPPMHPADNPAHSRHVSSSPWSEAPPPPDEPPPAAPLSAPTTTQPSQHSGELPPSSSAQPAATAAAPSGPNQAAVHMPMPASAGGIATATTMPSVIRSAPTQVPPQTQAAVTAGDQNVTQLVTAGMAASSTTMADAAALSSQAPSTQSQLAHASTALPSAAESTRDAAKLPALADTAGEEQQGSIPSGKVPLRPDIVHSTSDAMDAS